MIVVSAVAGYGTLPAALLYYFFWLKHFNFFFFFKKKKTVHIAAQWSSFCFQKCYFNSTLLQEIKQEMILVIPCYNIFLNSMSFSSTVYYSTDKNNIFNNACP